MDQSTPDATSFTGVIPPVLTPLTPDYQVDTATLRRQVDRLIAADVDALFALGSSAETVFLTRPQRRVALEAIIDQAQGRLPVLVGVIDTTTPRVLEHVADALEAGAAALVATAPFYARISTVEISNHFRLIHEAAPEVPLFGYNVPVSVHTELPIADVIDLAGEGVLAGVKDSGGSDVYTRLLCDARDAAGLRGRFSVLTGSETTVDMDYLAGVDGVVPGLGNVDPVGYVELARTLAADDFVRGRRLQARLTRLMGVALTGDPQRCGGGGRGVGGFKVALEHLGVFPNHLMMPPQEPLADADIAAIHAIVDAADIQEPGR